MDRLKQILMIENPTRRLEAFNQWTASNMKIFESNQTVIHASKLSSEQRDMLVEHLSKDCVRQMLDENFVQLNQNNNMYRVKVCLLRKLY